jgi:hypothetical protein
LEQLATEEEEEEVPSEEEKRYRTTEIGVESMSGSWPYLPGATSKIGHVKPRYPQTYFNVTLIMMWAPTDDTSKQR